MAKAYTPLPQMVLPWEPVRPEGPLVCRQIDLPTAMRACEDWHYSHTIAQAGYMFGFWRGEYFDGIIAFRRHQVASLLKYWDERLSGHSIELVRIALRAQAERTDPTTRYISMAIKELYRDSEGLFEAVYSYSDSVMGHNGGVYRGGRQLLLYGRRWWARDINTIRESHVHSFNGASRH